jgi:hypothetical protein
VITWVDIFIMKAIWRWLVVFVSCNVIRRFHFGVVQHYGYRKAISSLWRFVLCNGMCDGGGQFSVVKSKSGKS